MEYYYDDTAWLKCRPDDLWIFDKLILSKKLGYTCGPSGVPVPTPGNYIIRPITNIMGMGIDAEFKWLEDDTEDLPAGSFWCEIFNGRHLSVDYVNGEQINCIEGFKNDKAQIYKWNKWESVNDNVPLPTILNYFKTKYKYINCEFIDGNLIEAHLRLNSNFRGETTVLYVVWEGEDTTPPDGMEFIEEQDYKRLGFFKPIK